MVFEMFMRPRSVSESPLDARRDVKRFEDLEHEAVLQAVEGLGVVEHEHDAAVGGPIVVYVMGCLADDSYVFVVRPARAVAGLWVAE